MGTRSVDDLRPAGQLSPSHWRYLGTCYHPVIATADQAADFPPVPTSDKQYYLAIPRYLAYSLCCTSVASALYVLAAPAAPPTKPPVPTAEVYH